MRTLLFMALVAFATGAIAADENVQVRSEFLNSRIRFEREGKGHVAFLGGSITEMNGYRPLVSEFLRRRFPETEFEFTDAGIASTCSTTGAFRLSRDVLTQGPVDLLFVEFAVNDDQDAAHSARDALRGMEGIVRQTLRHNPRAEIVIVYFVNPPMLEQIQQGTTPIPIASHERVAQHYSISSINLAREVAHRIERGMLTWGEYGGTHPSPAGNAIPALMISEMLARAWQGGLPETARFTRTSLPPPIDETSYERGRFVPVRDVTFGDGWTRRQPDWDSLAGTCRERFRNEELFCSTQPGAELTFTFEGTAAGAYVLAGPDAGILEYRIDEGEWNQLDLLHRYSARLHYPRTVMFAVDLPCSEHVVRVRRSSTTDDARPSPAVRVLQFVAN
jgi:lysophospholipase L1-like esterase